MKICTKCKCEQDKSCFSKSRRTKDKLKYRCKKCDKQYNQDHQEEINKRNKRWRLNNPEKAKKYNKQWRLNNPEKNTKHSKQWRLDNSEKDKECHTRWRRNNSEKISQYYQDNKEKINAQRRPYQRNKRKIDVNYKIAKNLRLRLYHALNHNFKSGSAVRDLGCSISGLKLHLESKFQPDMTWDNYGEWHIDHIKPLSKFDLTDRDQLLEACHYTNLQPLWAEENLKKGNR